MLYEIVLEDADGKRIGAALDELNDDYVAILPRTTAGSKYLKVFHNRVLQFTFEFSTPLFVRAGETKYFSAPSIKKEVK